MRYKYFFTALMCCLIICLLPCIAAAAQSPVGISAHYAHPVTGVVEDSGNNAAIGQGMTQSVLDSSAVYEQNESGAWVTVTLHMAQNIGRVSFAVQNRGDNAFYRVSAQEVGRSGDTVKYKFEVPAPNAVIRLEVEVKEMGRAVVFYGLMDGNVSLSADADAAVSAPAGSQSQFLPESGSSQSSIADPVSGQSQSANIDGSLMQRDASSLGAAVTNSDTKSQNNGFDDEHGLLTKDSPELAGITDHVSDNSPWGVITRAFVSGLVICLCILTIFSIFGASALWWIGRKLRMLNDWKEAELYDAEDKL